MRAIGYLQHCPKPSVSKQSPGERMASKQLSYVHGASETPLIYQTIGARFDEAAAR